MALQLPPPPPNWGEDLITEALDFCRSNQFASFYHITEFKYLVKINAALRKIVNGTFDDSNLLIAQLGQRCQVTFITANSLAMSGQNFEMCHLLRLCLELAGYAVYMNNNLERMALWIRRENNSEMKKIAKEEFKFYKIQNYIKQNLPNIWRRYDLLYKKCIDMGSHPNVNGIFHGMKIDKIDKTKRFTTIFSRGGTDYSADLFIMNMNIGLIFLELFGSALPEKLESETIATLHEITSVLRAYALKDSI